MNIILVLSNPVLVGLHFLTRLQLEEQMQRLPREPKNGGERLSEPLEGTAASSHSQPLESWPRGASHLVPNFLGKYGAGRR